MGAVRRAGGGEAGWTRSGRGDNGHGGGRSSGGNHRCERVLPEADVSLQRGPPTPVAGAVAWRKKNLCQGVVITFER